MIKRVIEVAERSARLNMDNRLLIIRLADGEEHRIPIGEIECLILGDAALSIAGSLLAALAEEGVAVLISGRNHLPVGMQLPLAGNYLQNERFRDQVSAGKPLCKRLWQTVVTAKIVSQGRLLRALHGDDDGLERLANQVRSGDPENLEGRAATRYWKNLFQKPFLRDRNLSDNNVLLNYGYSVLRAMTARAICGAGLHPTVGIHHHNRYDAYCLADDLMEPYRYVVDRTVFQLNPENNPVESVVQAQRRALLNGLQQYINCGDEQWTLPDLLISHARELTNSFATKKNRLEFI